MKVYKLTLLIAAISILSACNEQKQEAEEIPDKLEMKVNLFLQENGNAIPMNQVGNEPQTRVDNNLDGGFHLYGFFSTKDMPVELNTSTNTADEAPTRFFFKDTEISREGKYEDGVKRYWGADGMTRHSFFAYSGPLTTAPGEAAISKHDGGLTVSDYFPYVTIFQPADPTKQFDFLLTYGPTNMIVHQTSPAINLFFRHACARIVFKLMTTGGMTLYETSANAIYTTGKVSSTADVYYKPQEKSVSVPYTGTVANLTYPFYKGTKLIPSSASTEGKAIVLGELMLVPQYLALDWLEVTLTYKTSEKTMTFENKRTKVPPIRIESDKQYTFYLSISDMNPTLKISSVIIEPWETQNYMVDPLN